MKICWDNLDKVKLTKRGEFRLGKNYYQMYDACIQCGEPYLGQNGYNYCSRTCMFASNNYRELVSNKGKKHPLYGKHRSDNTKRKISESKSGENCLNETRQKISKANTGKTRTEDQKQKMRGPRPKLAGDKNPMFGKCGHLNPNWKGGISCEPYCQQWTDREYKDWIVYERDGRCYGPECNGKYTHKLVPHHINYNKKDCGPMNLIALCVSCNTKANYDREWHQSWYTEIMKVRDKLRKHVYGCSSWPICGRH